LRRRGRWHDPRASERILPGANVSESIVTLSKTVERVSKARLEIPTVYVNDNFGQWKSDFRHAVEHCCDANSRGAEISRMLRPAESDYFVLKPKHSGFYATTLELLLRHLRVNTLILTGIAANICVLFTANDAYMRDYKGFVPSDCVVANTGKETEYSLLQMKNVLKADIRDSAEIDLEALKGGGAAAFAACCHPAARRA
jgi:nicotinamidase-related amidase